MCTSNFSHANKKGAPGFEDMEREKNSEVLNVIVKLLNKCVANLNSPFEAFHIP